MRTRRFSSSELLTSIDVLNTIGGGTSEPQFLLKQFPNHREIRVKVPGVTDEKLKVEIHNNTLTVLYNFNILSDGLWIEVPKIVYRKSIPYFVDADKISVAFENDTLIVTLPSTQCQKGITKHFQPIVRNWRSPKKFTCWRLNEKFPTAVTRLFLNTQPEFPGSCSQR